MPISIETFQASRAADAPGQLEQLLLNLAVNARDAMPSGGNLKIETTNVHLDDEYVKTHPEARPGPHAMFIVSDTGCGIPADMRDRIFEPFFTTKGPGKGTGLGLAVVHGIVKQSDGHVNVYSEVGIGTTFKIYLPHHQGEVTSPAQRIETPALPRGTETVLLVEDEEGVRTLGRRILTECGYTVLDAVNGDAAVQAATTHAGPIHLLLSDVVMPNFGGRQVAQRIAELHPEVRVIFMSGYTDDDAILHGILQDGANFLQKPFTAFDLATRVRNVLNAEA